MKSRCPEVDVLLPAAENRLEPESAATWGRHLEACADCRRALVELRSVGTLLASLGQAERGAVPGDSWARVVARLERPRALDRLPPALSGAFRQAADLLEPPAAAGVAAALAGLVLGIWLAGSVSLGSGSSLAALPYETSTLLDTGSGELADTYFSTPAAAPRIGAPAASGASSEGSPAGSAPQGDSAAGDSGGAAR